LNIGLLCDIHIL